MSITQLPQSTIKLLSSSQVITSVSSAVKELIENSLDAGASNIDIKLDNNGLDRIEVKDDGAGISPSDAVLIGLAHHTSKISAFSDIESLESYGFRGEALNALCQVGNVTITTATCDDTVGMIYVLDKNGRVTSSKPTPKTKGTSVVVAYLFKNIPVRRQFYSNNKRAKDELRQVETIVKTLGVVNPQVRFTLFHNKCMIWQKTSVTELRQGLVYMLGYIPARELHELKIEGPEIKIEALVPRVGCDISILSKANPDWSMVFVNRRPVQFKTVYKVVCEYVFYQFGERLLQRKSPVFLVSFTLSPTRLDVNLEPNKSRVLVRDEDALLDELRKLLTQYYGNPGAKEETRNVESPAKKRKLDILEETLPLPPSKPVEILFENKQESRVFENSGKFEIVDTEPSPNPQSGHPTYPQNDPIAVGRPSVHEQENVAEIMNPTKNNLIKPWTLDESITAEKWSMGHMKITSDNTNFVQGPGVFIAGPKTAPPVKEKLQLPFASPSTNVLTTEEERQSPADDLQFFSTLEQRELDKDWPPSNRAANSTELFAPVKSPPRANNCSERLGPVISPPRPRNEKNCRKLPQPILRDDEIDMSVSSQMGRREFAGFTKFARDARPQIILENPGIAFTKVAVMLSDKWKNLPSEKREMFEEKAREHIMARKTQHNDFAFQPKISFEQKGKSAEQKNSSEPKSVVDPSKPPKSHHFNRSHTPYRVSIEKIKERVQQENVERKKTSEDDYIPVGHLEPSGGWVCLRSGMDLSLISPYRLQEVVLCHRLLATHTIPLRRMPLPQRLDKKDLGADNWNLLLSLNRTICDLDGKTMVVSSPIIVKNGFRIQLSQTERNIDVMLTHVADTISFYGIQDLLETLLLAATYGTNDLSLCRPLRVVNHIKGEAVRICRQDPSVMERHVLEELLRYWKIHLSPSDLCLHSKPIWTQIHSIAT